MQVILVAHLVHFWLYFLNIQYLMFTSNIIFTFEISMQLGVMSPSVKIRSEINSTRIIVHNKSQ